MACQAFGIESLSHLEVYREVEDSEERYDGSTPLRVGETLIFRCRVGEGFSFENDPEM